MTVKELKKYLETLEDSDEIRVHIISSGKSDRVYEVDDAFYSDEFILLCEE